MAATNTDSNPFWEFSNAVYARTGVARACLVLQEKHGVDVNLLLYALWRGYRGHHISTEDVLAMERTVADWRARVVQPIRVLRQRLRDYPGVEATRELLKQAELRAEQHQQQLMFEAICAEIDVGVDGDVDIDNALTQFARAQNLNPDELAVFGSTVRAAIQGLER